MSWFERLPIPDFKSTKTCFIKDMIMFRGHSVGKSGVVDSDLLNRSGSLVAIQLKILKI